ncbi:FecR family protein [Sphingomonas jeddahensis]|uniref:Fec operon regulator FecR n=1 Tax=Sphingomonas jeddahensis TaxID=1915074 RepID=A0A1V2EXE8_9SPHN|nr:FecR domain-containing protein [Sphingomonas jeddahensis]ONF96978.1 fec operon regulator FecR [Sphingomonas jeddahensis]
MTDRSETPAEAAAAWYARSRNPSMSAAERARFDAWLNADDEHAAAWDRVSRVNALLGQLGNDPAIEEMRRAAREPAQRSSRRWPLAAALAAALVAAVGLPLSSGWLDTASAPDLVVAQHYAAASAPRTIALADGSTMQLDARSSADVAIGSTRAVTLTQGRALFTVAKDEAHPFVVTASGSTVTALGTQFGVERGARETIVALLEGSVRVVTPAGARTLRPGETLRASDGALAVGDGAESVTAWRTGRLDFSAVPLADVAEALNRYATRRVIIADAALARQPYSGSFTADGGADALVTGLVATRTARVVARTDQSVTLAR